MNIRAMKLIAQGHGITNCALGAKAILIGVSLQMGGINWQLLIAVVQLARSEVQLRLTRNGAHGSTAKCLHFLVMLSVLR
jgi:hypothetical protein